MDDEPEIAFEADGNALADAAQFADGAALDGCDGRVDGAQDKDALQANALEGLAEDARFERGEVGGDVGQFRHCIQIEAGAGASATSFFRWLN